MYRESTNKNKGRGSKEDRGRSYIVAKADTLLPFLLSVIKGQSRNNVKRLLSKKMVLVDGVRVSQFDYPLHMKQTVRVLPRPSKEAPLNRYLHIIYEDDDFLAIDKPAGLLSVASDTEDQATAYRMASDYVRLKDKRKHIYVVHRLDKETSGVLLFTKSLKLRELMQENWNETTTLREYIAVVHGKFPQKKGAIHTWLKQANDLSMHSSTDKKNGLEAITEYEVLAENERYSLARVHLKTGRKNQIRVHFSELHCPVVGDARYGEKDDDPLKRLGLHAAKMEFIHPYTKQKILIAAKEPAAFRNLLRRGRG